MFATTKRMEKPLRIPYYHGVPIDLCELAMWMARCQRFDVNLDLEQQPNLIIQNIFTNSTILSSKRNTAMYIKEEGIHTVTRILNMEPSLNKNSNESDELMTVCEELMDISQNPLPLIEPYRCFPQLSPRMT